mmetsp:Transcript_17612/g.50102  ORF Transcript_17612/g.50102 Transcript_17612/m.50102 type:complete len:220 (+) Transcript_17612:12-671(+)
MIHGTTRPTARSSSRAPARARPGLGLTPGGAAIRLHGRRGVGHSWGNFARKLRVRAARQDVGEAARPQRSERPTSRGHRLSGRPGGAARQPGSSGAAPRLRRRAPATFIAGGVPPSHAGRRRRRRVSRRSRCGGAHGGIGGHRDGRRHGQRLQLRRHIQGGPGSAAGGVHHGPVAEAPRRSGSDLRGKLQGRRGSPPGGLEAVGLVADGAAGGEGRRGA